MQGIRNKDHFPEKLDHKDIFSKYNTFTRLREIILEAIDNDPSLVDTGILYVLDEYESDLLSKRYHRNRVLEITSYLSKKKLNHFRDSLMDILIPLSKKLLKHGIEIELPSIYIDDDFAELYWSNDIFDLLIEVPIEGNIVLNAIIKDEYEFDFITEKDYLVNQFIGCLKSFL